MELFDSDNSLLLARGIYSQSSLDEISKQQGQSTARPGRAWTAQEKEDVKQFYLSRTFSSDKEFLADLHQHKGVALPFSTFKKWSTKWSGERARGPPNPKRGRPVSTWTADQKNMVRQLFLKRDPLQSFVEFAGHVHDKLLLKIPSHTLKQWKEEWLKEASTANQASTMGELNFSQVTSSSKSQAQHAIDMSPTAVAVRRLGCTIARKAMNPPSWVSNRPTVIQSSDSEEDSDSPIMVNSDSDGIAEMVKTADDRKSSTFGLLADESGQGSGGEQSFSSDSSGGFRKQTSTVPKPRKKQEKGKKRPRRTTQASSAKIARQEVMVSRSGRKVTRAPLFDSSNEDDAESESSDHESQSHLSSQRRQSSRTGRKGKGVKQKRRRPRVNNQSNWQKETASSQVLELVKPPEPAAELEYHHSAIIESLQNLADGNLPLKMSREDVLDELFHGAILSAGCLEH